MCGFSLIGVSVSNYLPWFDTGAWAFSEVSKYNILEGVVAYVLARMRLRRMGSHVWTTIVVVSEFDDCSRSHEVTTTKQLQHRDVIE